MADKENFPVRITAVDGFTKVLQGIRNQMGGFSDSFEKAGKAMTALKKDSGWTAFSNELSAAKDNAITMAGSIANILTPLGAVAGGIGLASVRGMSSDFAQYTRDVNLAAQRTKFTAGEIQSLGAVARMSGMDTSNLSNEAVHLDQVLRSAVYNNPEAMGIFTKMGIPVVSGMTTDATSPDYRRSNMDILKDVGAWYKQKTMEGRGSAAEFMIQQLGLGYWTPALAMGREGIEKSESIQQQYGFKPTQNESQGGSNLFFSEQKTLTAWDSLSKSIGAGAAPAFARLNDEVSIWLKKEADSRELGRQIGESFDHLANGVLSVIGGFTRAGEKMGVFRDDADAIVTIIEVGMIGAFAKLTLTLGAFMANFMKQSAIFALSPLGRFLLGTAAVAETWKHPTWLIDWSNEKMLQGTEYVTGMKRNPDYKPQEYQGTLGDLFGKSVSDSIPGRIFSSIGSMFDIIRTDNMIKSNVKVDVNLGGAVPPGTTAKITGAGGNVTAAAKVVHNTTGSW